MTSHEESDQEAPAALEAECELVSAAALGREPWLSDGAATGRRTLEPAERSELGPAAGRFPLLR